MSPYFDIYAEMGNILSSAVQSALATRCAMCFAEPGELCHNTINGFPLSGRLVHLYRIEDK